MRKFLASVLLVFLFFWQFQWVALLYASEQSELKSEKDRSVKTLDAFEDIIDTSVEKLDTTIKDTDVSDKLKEKHKEIWEYLDDVESEIQNQKSGEDIQARVEEAKKVVVLKVVSWVTEYEDIEDNITQEVWNTLWEKEEAREILQDSLEWEDNDYSLIIKTKYSTKKVEKILWGFDESTSIELLYKSWKDKYFEILLQKDSLFSREILGDIDTGILPSSFGAMEIVQPEVFTINAVKSAARVQKNLLKWEDLTHTWGVEKYQTYRYFTETKKASKQIKVGVVDTGVDYNHPDLRKRVLINQGRDFVNKDRDAMDDQWHGTHVAGTIAANINKSGIVGINPYTRLVPLKICSESGFCPTYAVIKSLSYATKRNIDILNMSLGGRWDPVGHPICDAISAYSAAGWIAVVAAWNNNVNTNSFVPGWCSDAITVAATDTNDVRAPFSNYGDKVDVSAPWVDIYSSSLDDSYKKLSGTSMSTPHVTGIISLMQSYDLDITTNEVRELFTRSQSSIQSESSKYIAGWVNFDLLIDTIKNPEDVSEVIEEEVIREEVWGEGEELWGKTEIGILDAEFFVQPEIPEQSSDWDIQDTLDFSEELKYFSGSYINAQEFRTIPEVLWEVDGIIMLWEQNSEDNIEINSLEVELYEAVENVEISEIQFQSWNVIESEVYKTEFIDDTMGDSGVEINSHTEWGWVVVIPGDEVKYQEQTFELLALDDTAVWWIEINSTDENTQWEEVSEQVIWELLLSWSWQVVFSEESEEDLEATQTEIFVHTQEPEEIIEINSLETQGEEIIVEEEIEYTDSTILDIDIQWVDISDGIEINAISIEEEIPELIETQEELYPIQYIWDDIEEVELVEWYEEIEQIVEENDEWSEWDEGVWIQNIMYHTAKLWETSFVYFDDANTFDYSFSITNKVGSFARWDAIAIIPYSPWSVTVYAKKGWVLKHKIYITIEAMKSQWEIFEWQQINFQQNHLKNTPTFSYSNPGVASATHCGTWVCVTWLSWGTTTVYVKDSVWTIWYEYEVTVQGKQIHNISIDEGKKITVPFERASSYSYSYSAYNFVYASRDANNFYITGRKPGSVTVYIKYGSLVIGELRVTIRKIPETNYSCSTLEQEYCSIDIPNLSDYTFTYSQAGIFTWYKYWDALKVYGLTSGNSTLYLKKNGELYSTINVSVSPWASIPQYSCAVKQGHTCYFPFTHGESYIFTESGSWDVYPYFRNGNIEMYARTPGTRKILFKQHSSYIWEQKTLAEITVEIWAQPAKQTASCSILNTNSCLYDLSSASSYTYSTPNPELVTLTKSGTQFRIRWKATGSTTVYVKSGDYIIYQVAVSIQNPPTTKTVDCDIYQTQKCAYALSNAKSYEYSVSSWGKWSITKYTSSFLFTATNPGTTTLYVRDENIVLYRVNITVKQTPPVTKKSLNILDTKDEFVEIDNNLAYNITKIWDWDVGTWWYNKNAATGKYGMIKIEGAHLWQVLLYLRDTQENLLRYIITIDVVEIVQNKTANCTIDQYDRCEISFPYIEDYNYTWKFEDLERGLASNPIEYDMVAEYHKQPNTLVITGWKPGRDTLNMKLGSMESYSVNINVLENVSKFPVMKQVKCEVLEWDDCQFILDDARYYRYSNPAWDVVAGSKSFKFYGHTPWVHTAYVLQWNAPIYEIEMTVIEKEENDPLFEIDIIEGQCSIKLYDSCLVVIPWADKYEFRSFFGGASELAVNGEALNITALKPWHNYITWYHFDIPVVRVVVYADYQESDLTLSEYSADIEIGSTKSVGLYALNPTTVRSASSTIASVTKVSDARIDITANKLWFTQINIEDEYYNSKIFYVNAIEKPLSVSTKELIVAMWQSAYFTVNDSWEYNVTQQSNIVWVYTTETQNIFRIKWNQLGDVRLYVSGNGKGEYINVRVVESIWETQTPKIRYIRDWLSGSNRNSWNHWVEIEAIDNNGENKALGKSLTSNTAFYSSRPISKLTDGNKHYGDYWSTWPWNKYAQVDLWDLYDITQVNIWHYYNDSYTSTKTWRIYNNTKTEVSSDWQTWYTLFDSATEWTYVEPQDGSGRNYDVEERIGDIEGRDTSFKTISYQEKWSEEWMNTITFKLEWSFEEVGIMYLKNDQIYKQALEEEATDWYTITCNDCPERSVPYVLSDNTYRKASVEYYTFNQDIYEISNIDSGIEINAIIIAGGDFYQVGKPFNWVNPPIAYQYLEWIEIAMYDFLNYDINNIYSWDTNTAIELAKISAWTRSLQSSIDAVPDIKKLWDGINSDIQSWLYAYSDNDRRFLKWYLGSSAVIEEKDWQNFNQSRVTQEINKFHQKRRIATYSFWTADSEIQEYIDLVSSIDNWLHSRIKKSGNYWVYVDWLYPHLYTESSVVFLKSKNLISQAEYDVLIKYQTQLKYLYTEAIKEHILTETQAWISEWRDQAIEDYIVESLLLFNPFEFAEIVSWLSELELSDITEGFELLVDVYNNREEIFAWLSEYDKAYYTAYIKTTLAMAAIPAKLNKVNKLKWKDTETIQELKQLKKDIWFPWVKYVPNPRGKIEAEIDHVVKIKMVTDDDGISSFGWVHSRKAILDYNTEKWAWSAWFENLDESIDTWNKPYIAKVKAKDDYGNPIIKTGNNGFSWIFPDSWSEARIMDEVEYAIRNNKWLADSNATWQWLNIFRWPSTVDGIEIDFVYIKDTDKMPTYYPVVK